MRVGCLQGVEKDQLRLAGDYFQRPGKASTTWPAGLVHTNAPSTSPRRSWARKLFAAASLSKGPASRRLDWPQTLVDGRLPLKAASTSRDMRRQSKARAALSRPVAS